MNLKHNPCPRVHSFECTSYSWWNLPRTYASRIPDHSQYTTRLVTSRRNASVLPCTMMGRWQLSEMEFSSSANLCQILYFSRLKRGFRNPKCCPLSLPRMSFLF